MNFIYFGSSHFSLIVLETIFAQGLIPQLIISQPDKPQGRGMKLQPTAISMFAQVKKISLLKPVSLKDQQTITVLKQNSPDFFVVADYGKILSAELLAIPKIMSLCVHPSLLPRYRGPAPINWALINGDSETGVTIFKMNGKIDQGEIISQTRRPIASEDNLITLIVSLAQSGGLLLGETLADIEQKKYILLSQNENNATYDHKLKKEDGKIIWTNSAEKINNLVRGTLGWPSAYTDYKNVLIKIIQADVIEEAANEQPGTVSKVDKQGIYVCTGKNILRIIKVKPEGKNEMPAWAFVCGHKLQPGDRFD